MEPPNASLSEITKTIHTKLHHRFPVNLKLKSS